MIIDGFNISESGGTSGVSTVSVSASRNEDFVAKTTAIEVDSAVGNIKRVINLTQSAAVGYEYTPVIYIWNDGLSTGEIDLGYVPGDNTVIEMDVEPENSATQGRKILWFDDFQYYAYNSYQYFANNGSAQTVKTNLNRSVISLSHTVGGWSWSGVTDTVKVYGSDGRAKIYGIKIYEDNVLVRDYVPALDSNGVPCLFDKVNFEYYYFKVNGEISSALTSGGYFVEYLQGNNSDYINLNYVPVSNTYFEMDIQGIVCAGESNGYGMYWLADTKYVWRYASYYRIIQFSEVPNEQRHILKFGKEYYVNGVQQGSTTAGWQTQSLSAYVLAVHDGNNVNGKTTGILYGLKIYEGSTLVRDFVPSVINNQVGLYDKITGTFRPSVQNTLTSGSVVTERVVYDESAVTISNSDISTVYVGDTVSLNASTTPTGVTLSYSSSDPSVAAVDANGVISGVSDGNAVITITSGELRDDANQVHYYPVKKKVSITSQSNPEHKYLTFTALEATDISMPNIDDKVIYYKATGDSDYTRMTSATTISLSTGDSVKFYGENETLSGKTFDSTGTFNASGHVTSLLSSTSPSTLSSTGEFSNLFTSTDIVSASGIVMPTNVTESCYKSMFSNCYQLTSTPTLPATTLASSCYSTMFTNCSSLTSAPELPATVLANGCYANMFYGCSNLVTPPALPATTAPSSCYSHMFAGCSSLESAPALPATVLNNWSYDNMFFGCGNLTNVPELPATSVASSAYAHMFQYCGSITSAVMSGTSFGISACKGMFSGSTLSAITVDFTETPTDYSATALEGWLGDCAQYGVVYAPSNRTWDKNTSEAYIPSGWTVVNKGTQIDSVTGITIANSEPTGAIIEGDTFSLNASTTPTGMSLSYSSANSNVASVDSSGVITGMGSGSTTITITAQDYFDTTNHIYYVGTSKTVNVEVDVAAVLPATWSTDNLSLAFGQGFHPTTVPCTSIINRNGININAAYAGDYAEGTATVSGLKVVVTEQLNTLKLRVSQGVQDNEESGLANVDFGAVVDNYDLVGNTTISMTSASTVESSGVTFTYNNVPAGTYTFSPVLGEDNDSHGVLYIDEYYGPLNFNCYVDEATPYVITDDVHWDTASPGMYYATGMTDNPASRNRVCYLTQTITDGVQNLAGTATKATPSGGGYMGIISPLNIILDETISGLTFTIGVIEQDMSGDLAYNIVDSSSLTNVVLKGVTVSGSYNPTSLSLISQQSGVTATFNYPVPAGIYRLIIGGFVDPGYDDEWYNDSGDTFEVNVEISGGQPV